MREATLSLLGLYNYDSTVLDLLSLPEALERNTVIKNLLAETAELEILYPNPVVLKNLIGVWSLKEMPVWQKLYDSTIFEYNPIENYDRHEEETTSGTGSRTHSGTDTHTDTLTEGGTQGQSGTHSSTEGGTQGETSNYSMQQGGADTVRGTKESLHKVAGFDTPVGASTTLVEQSSDEETASTTTNYGRTENGNGSNTTTFGKTVSGTDGSTTTFGKTENRTGSLQHGEAINDQNSGTRNLYVHGNIGTVTAQDMIKQEREIAEFNIIDYIIHSFIERFCLLVY